MIGLYIYLNNQKYSFEEKYNLSDIHIREFYIYIELNTFILGELLKE